ncbi:hypothetical protein J6590_077912 [Homalodisca vitripennis]|nr:hypothetical protein J6590_077912 [Homalodisca vitripennis]
MAAKAIKIVYTSTNSTIHKKNCNSYYKIKRLTRYENVPGTQWLRKTSMMIQLTRGRLEDGEAGSKTLGQELSAQAHQIREWSSGSRDPVAEEDKYDDTTYQVNHRDCSAAEGGWRMERHGIKLLVRS